MGDDRGGEEGGRAVIHVYYFGCWGVHGHCLYTASGQHAYREEHLLPWTEIDGRLTPGQERRPNNRFMGVPFEFQVEGHAALHHKDGWTALAFWDRTVDKRYGANSAFIAEGTHDFDSMCALAEEHFPAVRKRVTGAFKVVLAVGSP